MLTEKTLLKKTLPELWALFEQATGETSRAPNKKFLVRHIIASADHGKEAGKQARSTLPGRAGNEAKGPKRPRSKSNAANAESTQPKSRKASRLKGMTTEQLRAAYVRVVGRPTGSKDDAYLRWKINQAEKGKVPVGPRKSAAEGEPTELMTIAIRIQRGAVRGLDRIVESKGHGSREALMKKTIKKMLTSHKDTTAAAYMEG